jgi:hypothetical protein
MNQERIPCIGLEAGGACGAGLEVASTGGVELEASVTPWSGGGSRSSGRGLL